MKLFYAAGPGDAVGAFSNWRRGVPDPTQMALTYSGQVCDFCESIQADTLIVGSGKPSQPVLDGKFVVEHLAKPLWSSAVGYHLSQVKYALALLRRARTFGAEVAVIHSDTTHLFLASLFWLFRMKVIIVLHNTLWPSGFPPSGAVAKIFSALNALFFRFFAYAVFGVSRECIEQVALITGGKRPILLEIRGLFRPEYFETIPPPPSVRQPLRMFFSGRVTENKGVFDIVRAARKVEDLKPGLVQWTICGGGPELERLRTFCAEVGLSNVEIRGHLLPHEMKVELSKSHASIVPTRSDFAEGMALAAAEAVLAGRPFISNQVVPALRAMPSASLEARTDDVDSYVDCVLSLATQPDLYERLRAACRDDGKQFYDHDLGLAARLKVALAGS